MIQLPSRDPVHTATAESRTRAASALAIELRPYGKAIRSRSLRELAVTLGGFAILWSVLAASLVHEFYPALVLVLPAGGMLLRLFVIQHDCGHGAFFASRAANDRLGHLLGVLTLTPYAVWKAAHARHHATSGNLDKRGIGDIDTLTRDEFLRLSPTRRALYRLYRHPAVMFGIGPAYLFLLRHRLPIGQMRRGPGPWLSAMLTNCAVLVALGSLSLLLGPWLVIAVHLPIVLLAASFGVWLFYVQHQFEATHWAPNAEWTFASAAVHSSSFYALPRVLHWFSGNIGYHHIHHLMCRIPFYRLPDVLRDHPHLGEIGRVSVRQSIAGVRLALWDEEHQRLVTFRTAEAAASRAR